MRRACDVLAYHNVYCEGFQEDYQSIYGDSPVCWSSGVNLASVWRASKGLKRSVRRVPKESVEGLQRSVRRLPGFNWLTLSSTSTNAARVGGRSTAGGSRRLGAESTIAEPDPIFLITSWRYPCRTDFLVGGCSAPTGGADHDWYLWWRMADWLWWYSFS